MFPPLPCFCALALRPAGAQASSFVSHLPLTGPQRGAACACPVSACFALTRIATVPLPSRAALPSCLSSFSVCVAWTALRCAALHCTAFACFSWPHACSMFAHTLHAGELDAGAHTLSSSACFALGTATLPRSLLLAPPPISASLPSAMEEAPPSSSPPSLVVLLLLLLIISSPSSSALLSPKGVNPEGSVPSFLSLFVLLRIVLSFYSSTSFYLCSVCLESNRRF